MKARIETNVQLISCYKITFQIERNLLTRKEIKTLNYMPLMGNAFFNYLGLNFENISPVFSRSQGKLLVKFY